MVQNRLFAVFALIALVSLGSALATLAIADEPAGPPGSLTVTIVDEKDQPVPGAKFALYHVFDPSASHSGGGGAVHPMPKAAWGGEEPIELQKGFGPAVFSGITDDKGVVVVKSVKPGTYQYRCGNMAKGIKSGNVSVEAGKPQAITVKLEPPSKQPG